jgi:hypothetical protein
LCGIAGCDDDYAGAYGGDRFAVAEQFHWQPKFGDSKIQVCKCC